jgi:hypothetical protein
MSIVHLEVVFTTLQFTSYRCYGEESQSASQEKCGKTKTEPDMHFFWHHSHHDIAGGAKSAGLNLNVILQ